MSKVKRENIFVWILPILRPCGHTARRNTQWLVKRKIGKAWNYTVFPNRFYAALLSCLIRCTFYVLFLNLSRKQHKCKKYRPSWWPVLLQSYSVFAFSVKSITLSGRGFFYALGPPSRAGSVTLCRCARRPTPLDAVSSVWRTQQNLCHFVAFVLFRVFKTSSPSISALSPRNVNGSAPCFCCVRYFSCKKTPPMVWPRRCLNYLIFKSSHGISGIVTMIFLTHSILPCNLRFLGFSMVSFFIFWYPIFFLICHSVSLPFSISNYVRSCDPFSPFCLLNT